LRIWEKGEQEAEEENETRSDEEDRHQDVGSDKSENYDCYSDRGESKKSLMIQRR